MGQSGSLLSPLTVNKSLCIRSQRCTWLPREGSSYYRHHPPATDGLKDLLVDFYFSVHGSGSNIIKHRFHSDVVCVPLLREIRTKCEGLDV